MVDTGPQRHVLKRQELGKLPLDDLADQRATLFDDPQAPFEAEFHRREVQAVQETALHTRRSARFLLLPAPLP